MVLMSHNKHGEAFQQRDQVSGGVEEGGQTTVHPPYQIPEFDGGGVSE